MVSLSLYHEDIWGRGGTALHMNFTTRWNEQLAGFMPPPVQVCRANTWNLMFILLGEPQGLFQYCEEIDTFPSGNKTLYNQPIPSSPY